MIEAAFCMIVRGLLIKSAMVPFHFWLADAHPVAPSPVCVIFSGAMVAIGLFGVAKLVYAVFANYSEVRDVVRNAIMGSRPSAPWSVALWRCCSGTRRSAQLVPRNAPAPPGAFFQRPRKLHSGLIGDYVCWISIGFAAIVAAFALA